MSASLAPTKYNKSVKQWEVDDYMAALTSYNRPYKSIAVRTGNTVAISSATASVEYDPPLPPWIDYDDGGRDNVFAFEIDAYKAQLLALRNRTGNMANPNPNMMEILNRPPVPRPPPQSTVKNEARPAPVPVAGSSPPPASASETITAYNGRMYRDLYEQGRLMFQSLFPNGRYESEVANEPPVSGDDNYAVQEKFFELYDKLREIWAEVKGDEPFFIVMPRYMTVREGFAGLTGQHYPKPGHLSGEGFRSQAAYPNANLQSAEGFINQRQRSVEPFLTGRTCAPMTPNQTWFYNYSSARGTEKDRMKVDFCAGLPGYEYLPGEDPECITNCYLKVAPPTGGTVTPMGGSGSAQAPPAYVPPTLGSTPNSTGPPPIGTTMADGITPDSSQTSRTTTITSGGQIQQIRPTYIGQSVANVQADAKQYLYRWHNFDQSADIDKVAKQTASYNKDAYAFQMAKKPEFKIADIKSYYDMLTSYNEFWLYKYGWRDQSNRDRPYNPPIAVWMDPDNEPEDNAYMQTLATYNDKVKNLMRQYAENSPAVRLPDDLQPLPEPPAYPSLLKDLLTNPQKYADAQQGGSAIPPAKNDQSYTLPTAYLVSMLQAARDKLQFPASTSSSAIGGGGPLPKCPGGACKKYNDYVPDFVKKYFEDQEAKKRQQKTQSGFLDYAFGRPML